MYDVINNFYRFIATLQMETGNVPDRSNNIPVSTGVQNVMIVTERTQQRFDTMETLYKLLSREGECTSFHTSYQTN